MIDLKRSWDSILPQMWLHQYLNLDQTSGVESGWFCSCLQVWETVDRLCWCWVRGVWLYLAVNAEWCGRALLLGGAREVRADSAKLFHAEMSKQQRWKVFDFVVGLSTGRHRKLLWPQCSCFPTLCLPPPSPRLCELVWHGRGGDSLCFWWAKGRGSAPQHRRETMWKNRKVLCCSVPL